MINTQSYTLEVYVRREFFTILRLLLLSNRFKRVVFPLQFFIPVYMQKQKTLFALPEIRLVHKKNKESIVWTIPSKMIRLFHFPVKKTRSGFFLVEQI